MNSQANIEFKKNKLALLKKQLQKLEQEYSALSKSSIFEQKLPLFNNEHELLELSKTKNKEHIDRLRKYNSLRDSGIHLVDLVAEDKNKSGDSDKIIKKMDIIAELGYEGLE